VDFGGTETHNRKRFGKRGVKEKEGSGPLGSSVLGGLVANSLAALGNDGKRSSRNGVRILAMLRFRTPLVWERAR